MTEELPDQVADVYRKLAEATAGLGVVHKTQTADTGKYTYRYASLSDVIDAVNEQLEKLSLVFWQPIQLVDQNMQIITVIADKTTGVTVSFAGPAFPVKGDPQAVGSAISYARRYALTSLFGLKVEDDDGAMAHRAETKPGQRTQAEAEIRELVRQLPEPKRERFQADFIDTFGCTLTNLPESRHGEALANTLSWLDAHKDTE